MKIVLMGYMGSGKTAMGKYLNRMLGLKTIDLDKYIEHIEEMSVSEIFRRYGEGGFREMECFHLRQIMHIGISVRIAAGTGRTAGMQQHETSSSERENRRPAVGIRPAEPQSTGALLQDGGFRTVRGNAQYRRIGRSIGTAYKGERHSMTSGADKRISFTNNIINTIFPYDQ